MTGPRPAWQPPETSDSGPDVQLEARLSGARDLVEQLPTGDLHRAVRWRLERDLAPSAQRDRAVWRAVVLGAAAIVVLAGGVAATFGLPHVSFEILPDSGANTGTQTRVGAGWTYDREVGIDEARSVSGGTLVWPSSLGTPDHFFIEAVGSATLVSLVYIPRSDLPASGSGGPGALLLEVSGQLETLHITKQIPGSGIVEGVDLDGIAGYWISGAPHRVAIDTVNGEQLREVVAGDTLVWESEGVVFRLETGAGRERSITLAREMLGAASRPAGGGAQP